jgi:hypothetical protein
MLIQTGESAPRLQRNAPGLSRFLWGLVEIDRCEKWRSHEIVHDVACLRIKEDVSFYSIQPEPSAREILTFEIKKTFGRLSREDPSVKLPPLEIQNCLKFRNSRGFEWPVATSSEYYS